MISLTKGAGAVVEGAPVNPLLRQASINWRIERVEEAAKHLAEAAKAFESMGVLTATEGRIADNIKEQLYISTVLIQELRKL